MRWRRLFVLTLVSAGVIGTLEKIINDDELVFIFVGGKGGVGKSTTSAAIATMMADELKRRGSDKKVLLVSTDPAHSLGDAFRQDFTSNGTGVPVEGYEGVNVLELDPAQMLTKEVKFWEKLAKKAGLGGEEARFNDLAKWLVALPGIDEATALASVVNRLEKSQYGVVVFDTAPTGHTLKLLELPPVLQKGLDGIKDAGGYLWNMKKMMSMFGGKGQDDPDKFKREFEKRLTQYKAGVEKVGRIISDQERTTFVVVCIAEHMSVMETTRLIGELAKNKVRSSHVVVNQMVQEEHSSEDIQSVETSPLPEAVRTRVRSSLQLLSARGRLQQKYLQQLLAEVDKTIVPVPLLAEEPGGPAGLRQFGELLLGQSKRPDASHAEL